MEEESSDLPFHTPYNGGARPKLHDSMINAPTEEKNDAIMQVKSILEKIADEGSNITKNDLNRQFQSDNTGNMLGAIGSNQVEFDPVLY